MINRFFDIEFTQETVVVVTNIIMRPLEHVAGVESVIKEEPSKDLNFHCAIGFPQPLEDRMCLELTKVEVVIIS